MDDIMIFWKNERNAFKDEKKMELLPGSAGQETE